MDPKLNHLPTPHFVLIPFMSPGHIIPMVDMAKLLAKRGVTVSIVTTPASGLKFNAAIASAVASGLPIRVLQIPFPSAEVGLPEGCESAEDVPSYHLLRNFFTAVIFLQQPAEKLLAELKPKPSCIICDKHIPWLSQTSDKLQIPRIIFDGMSCFSQLCTHSLLISKIYEEVPDSVSFVLPGLPDRIEMRRAQLPGTFNPGSIYLQDFREQVRESEVKAYGVVVNSFEELEQSYVNGYRELKEGKVWCIGPLSLAEKEHVGKAHRGNKASIDMRRCLEWLDSWEPATVVYTCLGSLSRLTPPQLIELALGLEASNRPFIFVVRAGGRAREMEEWIEENGFEERTKKRGLLIRGWAPQVLILSHPSIGAFLTHCGWNSTLEGVSAGVPMITWPLFAEQFFNEKLVVQVLKIGTSVGAQAVVQLGEEDKCGVEVKREDFKKAIEEVMSEGEEGEEIRRRAKQLGEVAQKAVEEGGSSCLNTTMLIQDILQKAK